MDTTVNDRSWSQKDVNIRFWIIYKTNLMHTCKEKEQFKIINSNIPLFPPLSLRLKTLPKCIWQSSCNDIRIFEIWSVHTPWPRIRKFNYSRKVRFKSKVSFMVSGSGIIIIACVCYKIQECGLRRYIYT